ETANAPLAPNATPEKVEPNFIIKTDLYRVEFTNQGATVKSWQLRDPRYKGKDGKPLELVNTAATIDRPFSLYFQNKAPAQGINWRWYKQTPDPDNFGVTYEFSDGRCSVRKVFRFQQNSYLAMISTEVTFDGQPVPHLVQWRGGFGDFTVASVAGNQRTLYFDVAENKLHEQGVKDAKTGPVTNTSNFTFFAIASHHSYECALLFQGSSITHIIFADRFKTTNPEVDEQLFPGIAVSDGTANRFDLFVGPKDLDLLAKINPKLTQTVDFGWLSFLAK